MQALLGAAGLVQLQSLDHLIEEGPDAVMQLALLQVR
jgi:hypothetical protein